MSDAAAASTRNRGKRQPRPIAVRWAAVAALAGRQWGVVDDADLRALGFSASAVDRGVASARLHRRHSGVYSVTAGPLPSEGRWLAAVFAAGNGAVLSHRSAAALWGLSERRPRTVEVTAGRRGRRQRLAGVVIHESRRLSADQLTVHRGIAVTTVSRTLADLAALISARDLARAMERAELLQQLDVPSLLAASARRPGAAAVRRVVSDWAPAPTRRELERRLLELVRSRRLPMPAVNVRVEGFEVDLLWPGARLVVEADSMAFHASRAAMERDRARDAVLAARGYRVLRVTWAQVTRRPGEVEAALRAALA